MLRVRKSASCVVLAISLEEEEEEEEPHGLYISTVRAALEGVPHRSWRRWSPLAQLPPPGKEAVIVEEP